MRIVLPIAERCFEVGELLGLKGEELEPGETEPGETNSRVALASIVSVTRFLGAASPGRCSSGESPSVSRRARPAERSAVFAFRSNLVVAAVSLQFTLGIVTLLHGVPVSLGGMHQAGAVILLGCLLALLHGTSRPIDYSTPDKPAGLS